MKKLMNLLFIAIFSTSFLVCAQGQSNQNSKIEILYFHATQRCPTCLAIENNAKKLLNESFKSNLNDGSIKFVTYNIDENANKPIVDKYQIGFSTLMIVKKVGTKETKTDFTDKAFQYARTNPAKYAELLKAEINRMMR